MLLLYVKKREKARPKKIAPPCQSSGAFTSSSETKPKRGSGDFAFQKNIYYHTF